MSYQMPLGEGPKFTVDGVALPFTGVHIGQLFDMKAQIKVDAINAEGPSYVIEVLNVSFPGMDAGMPSQRKRDKQRRSMPPRR